MKRRFSPQRLRQLYVSALKAAFFFAPLFKFENAVQFPDFSLFAKL